MGAVRRAATAAGLMIVMALSLTACIHMDRSVALNGDGSGTYTLTIGFSEQLVSLGSDQLTSSMNQFGDKVKQQGGSYRHYDDTGYSYWAYTRPFNSIAQLNGFVKEAPQSGDTSSLGGGVTPSTTDTLTFSEQSGAFTNTFHVTGHMSMKVPQSATDTGGVDVSQYLKDMRESFSVTMPGSITAHTGGTVNGNTATYTVHYGEETDIDVTGSGLNTALLLPASGVVVVLLLVAALVAFLIWRGRQRQPATEAAMAGAAAAAGVETTGPASPDAPTIPGSGE